MKRHKFHAKPQKTDDGFFASIGEYRRWCELKMLQQAGSIRNLERQVSIPLTTCDPSGSRVPIVVGRREARYVADFAYTEADGRRVYEDFKGAEMPIGKLKRAIVLASLGIDVKISRSKRRRTR